MEFKDLVINTFPHQGQEQVSSPEPTSGLLDVDNGESRSEPEVQVHKNLQDSASSVRQIAGDGDGSAATVATTTPRSRSNGREKRPKSDEPAVTCADTVQDSSSHTAIKDNGPTSARHVTIKKSCGNEDELWNLLDVIQNKVTDLNLEMEFSRIRPSDDQLRQQRQRRWRRCRSLNSLSCSTFDDGNHCDCVFHVAELKRERDALLGRITELEALSQLNAVEIRRLLAEVGSIVDGNREQEERLCGD